MSDCQTYEAMAGWGGVSEIVSGDLHHVGMHAWRPYSGREHTVFILIQSSDDGGKGKETENSKPLSPLYDTKCLYI